MSTEENPWKITSSKIVYQNPWVRVREDKYVSPTGKSGVYAYMEHIDSVIVVAVNDKQEVCLIHTYRFPTREWSWEVPGGRGDEQEPLVAAKRELEEETGIIAKNWTKLAANRVCNGLLTEKMHIFLAQDLSLDGTKENADEPMKEVTFVAIPEVWRMIDSNKIDDNQTMAALLLAFRQLGV